MGNSITSVYSTGKCPHMRTVRSSTISTGAINLALCCDDYISMTLRPLLTYEDDLERSEAVLIDLHETLS
jgi:hypothetical protein